MPSFAQIKDMMSSRPVGEGRGFVNPPMAKREPLKMSPEMEDQPVSARVKDAKNLADMDRAYDEATVKKAKGGRVGYAKGGMTRGDGCCQKGHTKGKVV